MSLKENVEFLKEEISTEEKFFEGFFKLEKVWKKYKMVIIGGSVAIIVGFAGVNINQYLQTQTKIKANIAFDKLLENPKDQSAMKVLQETNPKLLAIAQYLSSNQDKIIDVPYLLDISKFNVAMEKGDIKALDKVLVDPNFLLKEYALFQKALYQTLDKNYSDAKATLKLIPKNSNVITLANKLNHYLLTK